jgi:hypothetical protein
MGGVKRKLRRLGEDLLLQSQGSRVMHWTWVRVLTAMFVFAVLAHASAPAAPALVIDDFADTAGSALSAGIRQLTVGSTAISDGPELHGVIGGVRRVTLTAAGMDLRGAEAITVRVVRAGSLLNYSSSLGARGRLRLVYDAGGAGLGADVSSADSIGVDILAADAAALPCRMSVKLSDGSRSAVLTQVVTQSGAQTVRFGLLGRFTRRISAPFSERGRVDLHHLRSITLTLTPGKSGDLEIGGIRTIGGRK